MNGDNADDLYLRAMPVINSIGDDPELMKYLALTAVNFLSVTGHDEAVAEIAHEAVNVMCGKCARPEEELVEA